MIILKVTKNQGFTLCLEDTVFEKPQDGGGGRSNLTSAYQLFAFVTFFAVVRFYFCKFFCLLISCTGNFLTSYVLILHFGLYLFLGFRITNFLLFPQFLALQID